MTIPMKPLLSQDEIHALFSNATSEDSILSSPREENETGVANPCSTPGGVPSRPATDPEIEERSFEGQNEKISAEIIASKFPAALAEAITLEGILRRCCQALREHFNLGRLSLVQPRSNTTTATIYSLDESRNSPLLGPHVIALEPSRLKESLLEQQELVACAVNSSKLDDMERDYLIALHADPDAVSVVYRPLVLQGELKGVLVLDLRETESLTPSQTSLLSYFGSHLAIAIERSDHHYMGHRRSRQLAIVSAIAEQAASEDDFNKFLREVCELLRKSFDYNSAQIWIENCNQLDLMGQAWKTTGEAGAGQRIPAMVQECGRRGQILCNNNLRSEFSMGPDREGRSQLAVPIHLRGKCLGVLFIESSRLDAFATEDFNSVESVASLIASRLYNSQVFKNSQRSGEYLQAILESADDWAFLSTDIHGYVFTCSVGSQRVFHMSQQEILGKDVLNLFTHPRIQRELIAHLGGDTTASCLERFHVPQTIGAETAYLDVTFQRVHDSEKHHIGFLCVVRDVTEKVLLERRLEKLTITDDITGLFNQRGFFRMIEAEIRRSRKCHHSLSLCFLDLDGLKEFNDTYGHLCGSQVLRETADLLREMVRPPIDTCCRYGGDEFLIIMPQISKIEAQAPIERIRLKLSEHFQRKITASFGIADLTDDILKATELLARADRAMYRAKSQGKNCIVLSD